MGTRVKHSCSYYINTLEYIEENIKPEIKDSNHMDLATINSNYLTGEFGIKKEKEQFNNNYLLKDLRDIQFRTQNYGIFEWLKLTDNQKSDFIFALKYGLAKLDDQIIDFLIYRNGSFEKLEHDFGFKSQLALRRIEFLQKQVRELKSIYGIKEKYYYPAPPANPKAPISKRITINVGPKASKEIIDQVLTQWTEGYTYYEKITINNETKEIRRLAKENIIKCIKMQQGELNLSNLKIGVLPDGIFCHLHHLKSLRLDKTDLTYLPKDISSLTELKSINLTDTPIEDFRNLHFQLKDTGAILILTPTDKSKYINVVLDNWIQEIYWFKTERNSRIQTKNKILDCIDQKSPVLDLKGMGLSSLPVDLLINYTNITKINYEGNELCDHALFSSLVNSEKLSVILNDDQISKLIELSLEEWVTQAVIKSKQAKVSILEAKRRILDCYKDDSEKLNLSGLNLATLPENIFKYLYSVKKLYVNSNQLETLPDSICLMTNLVKVNAANNKITTLPESIGNLRKLEELNLKKKSIDKTAIFDRPVKSA